MTLRHVLAVSAVAAVACSRGEAKMAQGQRPVEVRVAKAVQKDVPVEIQAVGRVVSNQSVAIRAQVSGTLVAVHFTEGQAVKKGDLLLEIDRRPYQAALDEAKARLAQDRVRAENARADAARYAELVEKEYVTRQQHDQARANADALDAAMAADRAAIERSALNLSYCAIRAPVTGRTGRLLVHAGNLVAGGGPEPLVTIEQVKPVWVSFSIPERHLGALRGWRDRPPAVRVRAEGGAREAVGALDFVDNAVDATTGTILLKARVENEDEALYPGQAVDTRLRISERSGATVVPASAVAQGQQGDYAFVVDAQGKAELRAVQVDVAGDAEAVIAKGIQPGETVVVEGQLKLRPGTPIRVLGDGDPAKEKAAAR